jgi:hypothetical protein
MVVQNSSPKRRNPTSHLLTRKTWKKAFWIVKIWLAKGLMVRDPTVPL